MDKRVKFCWTIKKKSKINSSEDGQTETGFQKSCSIHETKAGAPGGLKLHQTKGYWECEHAFNYACV